MKFYTELRYGLRSLLRTPSFSLLTIAIMTLGLSLTIYAFSFIYSATERDIPLPDGDRIFSVNVRVGANMSNRYFDPYSYQVIKQQANSFEAISYFVERDFTLTNTDKAIAYYGASVGEGFFEITQTQPLLGRLFNQSDYQGIGIIPVIISFRTWQDHFAGKANVIGQNVKLQGGAAQIVGVMPQGFNFPYTQQLWRPSALRPAQAQIPGRQGLNIVAKTKQGITTRQVDIELASLFSQLAQQAPDRYKNITPATHTFPYTMWGGGVDNIFTLMRLAVGFILLLSAINVANLLYARASSRAKDTAVRLALGAPRSRLVTQILMESLIICTISGVFAVLFSQLGLIITNEAMKAITMGELPYFWHYQLDSNILLIALSTTIATALLSGILPSLKLFNGPISPALRDGTRGAQSQQSSKTSKTIVTIEIFLSCTLLSVAGLIAIAVHSAANTDIGIPTGKALISNIKLPNYTYSTPEAKLSFLKQIQQKLLAEPEIEQVAIADSIPGQYSKNRRFDYQGFEKTKGNSYPSLSVVHTLPGSLQAQQVSLLQGRYFNHNDDMNNQNVAIVTSNIRQQLWPNESNLIGKKLKVTKELEFEETQWITIVGVIENLIHGPAITPFNNTPHVYLPNGQGHTDQVTLMIKGHTNDTSEHFKQGMELVPLQNQVIGNIDKHLPVFGFSHYNDFVKSTMSGFDFFRQVILDICHCFTCIGCIRDLRHCQSINRSQNT